MINNNKYIYYYFFEMTRVDWWNSDTWGKGSNCNSAYNCLSNGVVNAGEKPNWADQRLLGLNF